MIKSTINKISFQISACFIIFFAIAYFVNISELSESFNTILTSASFLYGFYIVYAISNAKSSHEKIITHLKSTEGTLLEVYALFIVFDKKTQTQLLQKIDNYIIATIDYKFEDYSMSTPQAIELLNFVQKVTTTNDKEALAQERSVEALEIMLKERVVVESEIANDITTVEWVIILLLLIVILFFIFSINSSGDLLLVFLKTVLASALALMIIILAKFNNLAWQEEKLIWKRLTITFQELSLLPYYPYFAYDKYFYKKDLPYSFRIAYYPEEYPDMSKKQIKIIKPNT